MLENVIVRGVTYQKNVTKITLQGVKKNTELVYHLFEKLARANIVIDSIVQDFYDENNVTVSFIVTEEDYKPSLAITQQIVKEIGAKGIHTHRNLSKVSIVGDGIAKEAGIASRMFKALSRSGIQMETINTSRIRISCLIGQSQLDEAVKAIHDEFELSKIKKEI